MNDWMVSRNMKKTFFIKAVKVYSDDGDDQKGKLPELYVYNYRQ